MNSTDKNRKSPWKLLIPILSLRPAKPKGVREPMKLQPESTQLVPRSCFADSFAGL